MGSIIDRAQCPIVLTLQGDYYEQRTTKNRRTKQSTNRIRLYV
jgi:hypothetical protein